MGFSYGNGDAPRPFAPAKIEFAKKKAKELCEEVTDLSLAQSQEAIARALGWADWHALDQAIKRGTPPSPPDEATEESEVQRRRVQQILVMLGLRLRYVDAEVVAAKLGLTCSAATAAARVSEVGPWGGFQEFVEEIAPGIHRGSCAKFDCYRLSADRQAAMHPLCKLEHGWYQVDDEEWRVVLSFPNEFKPGIVELAWDQLRNSEYFLWELIQGGDAHTILEGSYGFPTIKQLMEDATANKSDWFALSVFHDWAIRNERAPDEDQQQLLAVSAVQGADLLKILDVSRGLDRGTWLDVPVRWFALLTDDVEEVLSETSGLCVPAFRIADLRAWDHEPVAKLPFKRQPFSTFEIELSASVGFEPTVPHISVRGEPTYYERHEAS